MFCLPAPTSSFHLNAPPPAALHLQPALFGVLRPIDWLQLPDVRERGGAWMRSLLSGMCSGSQTNLAPRLSDTPAGNRPLVNLDYLPVLPHCTTWVFYLIMRLLTWTDQKKLTVLCLQFVLFFFVEENRFVSSSQWQIQQRWARAGCWPRSTRGYERTRSRPITSWWAENWEGKCACLISCIHWWRTNPLADFVHVLAECLQHTLVKLL